VVTLEIADGEVQAIQTIMGPAKLRHLGPPGDFTAMVHQRQSGGRRPE
jgi:hypothetical protein